MPEDVKYIFIALIALALTLIILFHIIKASVKAAIIEAEKEKKKL